MIKASFLIWNQPTYSSSLWASKNALTADFLYCTLSKKNIFVFLHYDCSLSENGVTYIYDIALRCWLKIFCRRRRPEVHFNLELIGFDVYDFCRNWVNGMFFEIGFERMGFEFIWYQRRERIFSKGNFLWQNSHSCLFLMALMGEGRKRIFQIRNRMSDYMKTNILLCIFPWTMSVNSFLKLSSPALIKRRNRYNCWELNGSVPTYKKTIHRFFKDLRFRPENWRASDFKSWEQVVASPSRWIVECRSIVRTRRFLPIPPVMTACWQKNRMPSSLQRKSCGRPGGFSHKTRFAFGICRELECPTNTSQLTSLQTECPGAASPT